MMVLLLMTMSTQWNYVKLEKKRFHMRLNAGFVFDDNVDAVELCQNGKGTSRLAFRCWCCF